ncbi:MAG: MBL fold metallo-hydrolase [Alphaproteobacteria bacterium]|nr:MBL fold metallo-hydrolase [Alphaproteobacteria bacterium]
MFVRFWGVRGSLACGGKNYSKYGGNTSCIEVMCGPFLFIFDAGTGIRSLGYNLINNKSSSNIDLDLFLTHWHLDHVVGLPFFKPLYYQNNHINIWTADLWKNKSTKDLVKDLMQEPFFPVTPDIFKAHVHYHTIPMHNIIEPRPGVTIQTLRLNHPNEAVGYRLTYQGRSICYCTDHEHGNQKMDDALIDFIKNADIFIYDSTYTDEEYNRCCGWGHSTWQVGIDFAKKAGVKTFVAFHHDPGHDDYFLDQVDIDLKKTFSQAHIAYEGLILPL